MTEQNFGIGFGIRQEQKQTLTLSHDMIQSIEILQYDSLQLEQHVRAALVENPVLEEVEPRDAEAVISIEAEQDRVRESHDLDDMERRTERWDTAAPRERAGFESWTAAPETLVDHLMEQLRTARAPERVREICAFLIDSLDERGYLMEDPADFLKVEEQDLRDAMDLLQSMDPPGVGARSLPECLVLQLRARKEDSPALLAIAGGMLEDVAHNRMGKISKALHCTVQEAQTYADRIRRLEPFPGSAFPGREGTGYVIPDVVVESRNGELVVSVDPDRQMGIRVSPYYRSVFDQSEPGDEVKEYLSKKLDEADLLLRSIRQRRETLLRVAGSIVRHQERFFRRGPGALRPLSMGEVAAEVDLHESTVSRAVNGKYLQCSFGVFGLRKFFGGGLRKAAAGTGSDGGAERADRDGSMAGRNSGEVSSALVKDRIREIIEAEDPAKPVSDQKISEQLSREGVQAARRTVAKYRESMRIPPASGRKRY